MTRPIGLEAVLRVRSSKGIKTNIFHDNFFLRSTDLLALPNVSPHHSFTAEVSIEEDLPGSIACFQTALLYTSAQGERRIRVITNAVPVTNRIEEVFSCADPFAITTLMAKMAIDKALFSKLEDARETLLLKLVDILGAYKTNCVTTHQQMNALFTSEQLRHLPALILGLIKSDVLRQVNGLSLDARSYKLSLMYACTTDYVIRAIYPRLYSLHNLNINVYFC